VRFTQRNCMTEWSFRSGRTYADPFNEVELDVIFRSPGGEELQVPAFWAGEQSWRVRFAPAEVGRYHYRTVCSDADNDDLHGIEGELEVAEYEGGNPLLRHGGLRVSENHRHLAHADGTPFFWLADTWWMALCSRLRWPGDFKELVADRVSKGFTVIQLVAGLYPDMAAFDERGDNEAGWPWERDWARINPAWFDLADLKMEWLVSQGLVPCVLGSWGYYLPWLGVERFKQHWRYLVARWGAYPVVWCLAGEGVMPWYLHKQTDQAKQDEAIQRAGWTEVGRYLREIDPYHRLVSIHPTRRGREQVEDDSVLDFEMLQTGHGDRTSLPNTVRSVTDAYAHEPTMPVINSEVCYEGILEASREEVQRFMFWSCILSGTCGHTYGANGIWQVNEEGKPYGPSPHGHSWGDRPWREAYQLPGSGQLGVAKRLLERYEWWRLEPHPEWVEPRWSHENYVLPYAAGIPGELRIIFLFNIMPRPVITQLEPGLRYRAFLFNPCTGVETNLGVAQADAEGSWAVPQIEIRRDWLLVLERT
jgi:hypothetical protein